MGRTTEEALKMIDETIIHPFDYEFRVGRTNKDKSKSYLIYVTDTALMRELQRCLGYEWSSYTEFKSNQVTCTIEFNGIKRCGSSGLKQDKFANFPDLIKSAESDAFKRACFRLGLAKYMYDFPSGGIWISKQVDDIYAQPKNREYLKGYCLYELLKQLAKNPCRCEKLNRVFQSIRSQHKFIGKCLKQGNIPVKKVLDTEQYERDPEEMNNN